MVQLVRSMKYSSVPIKVCNALSMLNLLAMSILPEIPNPKHDKDVTTCFITTANLKISMAHCTFQFYTSMRYVTYM